MKINFQSLHFKASPHLKKFVEEKVSKLAIINDKIISADVTLFSEVGDKAESAYCEIRLVIPSHDDFVKKNGESFEAAVADAVDALQKVLRRKKDKN